MPTLDPNEDKNKGKITDEQWQAINDSLKSLPLEKQLAYRTTKDQVENASSEQARYLACYFFSQYLLYRDSANNIFRKDGVDTQSFRDMLGKEILGEDD